MFSSGPLGFFYAAHSQMPSTVMHMTFSLTIGRVLVPMPTSDAHHWRRAADVQHQTQRESRRPVHEPGVRLTWA
jgi:hypothetical protein